ncbi:hypothetical protein E1286_16740 [Nonomuraea terrae]|uniref:DUF6286 domain-containing protein n=1 Tax=Nonomuraea terrae TaxID=2530383 RepID=A0A4R4YRD4_9ACTN|nr:DUF6286 domain-containing protein [Nonomuraea terrae]TDD47761.1 hypothetical protein E1286_16740 [Nonomuraea terrae]
MPSGALRGGEVPSGAHSAALETLHDKVADRAAVRAFRPRRRIPAVIVAVLLTLLGLLLAVETLSALFGRPLRLVPYDRMLAWASSTSWSNPWFLLGSALVALLGLALLATALAPGKLKMVPVRSGHRDLIIGVRPKSVARALAHAAEQVPGVRSARATLRGGTFTVIPTTSGWRKRDEFRKDVRDAVLARLAELDPAHPYRVAVHVKERK